MTIPKPLSCSQFERGPTSESPGSTAEPEDRLLSVGVGCRAGIAPAELISLISDVLVATPPSPAAPSSIASIDTRSDEPAIHAAALYFRVPTHFFSAEQLDVETPRLLTPSDAVFRRLGCHGVAEAAALAAAGPTAVLLAPKRRSAGATCAIAAIPPRR